MLIKISFNFQLCNARTKLENGLSDISFIQLTTLLIRYFDDHIKLALDKINLSWIKLKTCRNKRVYTVFVVVIMRYLVARYINVLCI